MVILLITCVCLFVYLKERKLDVYLSDRTSNYQPFVERYLYQGNYLKYNVSSEEYDFVIISDMDKKSKSENGKEWLGIMRSGKLKRKSTTGEYTLEWSEDETLKTAYNEAGRGMELSELVYFDGKLLTCDDRTGIIFEIIRPEGLVIPLYIVTEGNGKKEKGFKCEWMTVVYDKLYVGSIGKEFTVGGKSDNIGSQWIKVIDRTGKIEHVPWRDNFEALRKHSDTEFPKYMVHEAIMWNPIKREWFILPRRLSKQPYDEVEDEKKGTNVLFTASEDFSSIKMTEIGPFNPLRGTSSFKFIPFRDNEIVQLKTIESGDLIESYITIIDIEKNVVLMPDTLCGSVKYEGVEII